MGLLIGDVFRRAAAATPRGRRCRSATTCSPSRRWTAGEHDRAGLRAKGVGQGHRVAWWGETTLDAVPLFAALAKLGAVFVPLNPRLSAEERAPVLAKARPQLVLTSIDDADRGRRR